MTRAEIQLKAGQKRVKLSNRILYITNCISIGICPKCGKENSLEYENKPEYTNIFIQYHKGGHYSGHKCLKNNPILKKILESLTQRYFRKDYQYKNYNIGEKERYVLQNHL